MIKEDIRSSDMFPSLAADDLSDCRLAYAIRQSDSSLCLSHGVACPNGPDIVLGQFGSMDCGSFRKSALDMCIGGVIGTSAKKEMVGPNARSVIASVADLHSWWNLAVLQHPGVTMRVCGYSGSNHELAIAIRKSACGPFPAVVRLYNVSPESDVRANWLWRHTPFYQGKHHVH